MIEQTLPLTDLSEATCANAMWRADNSLLDMWLLDEQGGKALVDHYRG